MRDDASQRYDRPIFSGGAERGATGRETRGPVRPPRPGRRPRIGMQGRIFIFAAIAIGLLVALGYVYLSPRDQVYVLDTYQYVEVKTRDFQSVIVGDGRVVPDRVYAFTAPGAAVVTQILVTPGADVTEGQILAQLSSKDLADAVAEHEAAVETARLNYERAQVQVAADLKERSQALADAEERLAEAEEALPTKERLYELGGISKQELEEARAEVHDAEAAVVKAQEALTLAERQGELTLQEAEGKVKTAEQALAVARERYDALTVRASLSGKVLSVPVKLGQKLQSGAEIAQMTDVSQQHIEATVTTSQAASVDVGQRVRVITGREAFYGRVESISPQATTGESGTMVPVRVAIDPEVAAKLRPNEPVLCQFELGVEKDRPYVPRGPFFTSGDASFVYVIDETGTKAVRRDVRYGVIDGDAVEIVEGVEVGDRIIYSSYSAYRSYPEIRLAAGGGRPIE